MRTARRIAAVLAGLSLVATTLTSCDWPEGTRYVDEVFAGYDTTTGVTYRTTTTNTGRSVDLRLDLYESQGDTAAERPAIVWMFGGAWQGGDRNQLASYAQSSARRGYVGVTIDYRLWEGDEPFDLVEASDNGYEDAVAAVEWLQDHAADYGIDPDAVVVAGYSAGAINALHALYRPADTPVAGAISIAGMSFTGATAGKPAAIMFNGTTDGLVPFANAEALCAQAQDLGNQCKLVAYEGAGHEIGFTQAADISEQAHHYVFDAMLWPLGYRPTLVDQAA